MTKRIIISLQIELYTNQSVFRFKHGCPWQYALTSEFLEGSTWVQEHCRFIVKRGVAGVGNVGLLPPHRGSLLAAV